MNKPKLIQHLLVLSKNNNKMLCVQMTLISDIDQRNRPVRVTHDSQTLFLMSVSLGNDRWRTQRVNGLNQSICCDGFESI